MFNLIVHLKAKEKDYTDNINFHLSEMVKYCPLEPGCILWKAYQDKNNDENFFIVEEWQTKELWEQHMTFNTFRENYEKGILLFATREVFITKEIKEKKL